MNTSIDSFGPARPRHSGVPADLENVLVPILTRIVECGRGPPALAEWVGRRVECRALRGRPSWGSAERSLIRRLASDAAQAIGCGEVAGSLPAYATDTVLA
jgi:hypothetical protein